MKLDKKLNEFNQLLANYVCSVFPSNVCQFQDEDETLLFIESRKNSDGMEYSVTHVSVDLDMEVRETLNSAYPAKRLEMMENLKRNIGTQIRFKYSRNNVGKFAKKFIGTKKLLDAYNE